MASILQDIQSWSCPCSPLICARRTTTHLFIWQQQKCGPVSGSPMQRGAIGEHYQTPHFNPRHRHPPVMTVKTARVRLNRLRTGVWRFPFLLELWSFLRLVSVAQRNRTLAVLSSRSNPWTAWPNGSGWWSNRMAAQHLPRDLVRPIAADMDSLNWWRRSSPMPTRLSFSFLLQQTASKPFWHYFIPTHSRSTRLRTSSNLFYLELINLQGNLLSPITTGAFGGLIP